MRPYTCFSNVASDIFMVLSFLFLGLFHWQMYDVTGRASSSSHAPSGPGERKGDMGGWIATKACSRAETCVQEADFLRKKKKKLFI